MAKLTKEEKLAAAFKGVRGVPGQFEMALLRIEDALTEYQTGNVDDSTLINLLGECASRFAYHPKIADAFERILTQLPDDCTKSYFVGHVLEYADADSDLHDRLGKLGLEAIVRRLKDVELTDDKLELLYRAVDDARDIFTASGKGTEVELESGRLFLTLMPELWRRRHQVCLLDSFDVEYPANLLEALSQRISDVPGHPLRKVLAETTDRMGDNWMTQDDIRAMKRAQEQATTAKGGPKLGE